MTRIFGLGAFLTSKVSTRRSLRDTVRVSLILLACASLFAIPIAASTGESGGGHGGEATTFLWIAVLLLLAKLSGLVERIGMPPVLGELLMGVLIGNLFLVGIHWFDGVATNETLVFLAELGVVILLFQIGLESNLSEMKKVGVPATLVAIVGVVVPFGLGAWVVGPFFFPGQSQNAYLFLGAALTATSVGVTARVFKDLGKLKTAAAQMVLGAAVIDDVLGLIILAVVSAIASVGSVSTSAVIWITFKAVLFLVGAIVAGRLLAPIFGNALSRVQSGLAMKLTLALAFCLLTSALAAMIGLAPIVGAFAAGLVLDPVHFRHFRDPQVVEDIRLLTVDEPSQLQEKVRAAMEPHAHRHVEELIEPIGHFLIPLFFVLTGMRVRLEALFTLEVLPVALAVTVVAILGKLVAGLAATGGANRWTVGFGMVPRGEVGLIFAATGASLGVVDARLYSIIVAVVILTTLIPPPILAALIRRESSPGKEDPVVPAKRAA